MRKRTVVFAVIIALLLLCVGLLLFVEPSCANRSAEFLVEIDDVERRWYDALVAAENTPSDLLEGPIVDLQAIRSDAQGLEPPECAANAKISLSTHMDYVIAAFLLSKAQNPADEIADQFDLAWEWEEYYFDDLSYIKDE